MRLLGAIHQRFGLPAALPGEITALIKRADTVAAYWEATRLAGFSVGEAEVYFGTPADPARVPVVVAEAWPTAPSQQRFLERFAALAA